MSKKQIPAVLKARIANANAKGEGYVLPQSYNTIWTSSVQQMIDKGIAREVKEKGKNKSKKKGIWLKK